MADEDDLEWRRDPVPPPGSPVELKDNGTFVINQQTFALADPVSPLRVDDYLVTKNRGADEIIFIYTRTGRLVQGYRYEGAEWQVGLPPDTKQQPQSMADPPVSDNNAHKTLPYKSASGLGVIVLGVVTIIGMFLILLFHPAKRTEQKSSDTISDQSDVVIRDQHRKDDRKHDRPHLLPDDAAAKLKEARSLYEKKDFERAQKAAETVLESDDKNTDANEILAGCLIVSQKYQEAVDHLNTALDGRPNDPQLRLMRGTCYVELQFTEKARGDFQYLVDPTTPSNPTQREQAQAQLDQLDGKTGG